ncbi:MAG: HAD family hydrolase, partial [Faecalibacillus sp.]
QNIEKDFEIIKRKSDFSEIVPKNHSKATGIQYLVDYFHLSLNDCFVFGDSLNDESMLRYVQHAVVMKNGDKSLFDIAEYVTDDIEHDGIQKALKYYHLI